MYPLTVSGTFAGLFAGALTAVVSDSLLIGFAIATLFIAVAVTWKRDDAPVIPFLAAYQWTSITVGYWYLLWTGSFPGLYRPGDVERTVALSLAGLLVLVIGIRLVEGGLLRWFGRRAPKGPGREADATTITNVRLLFVIVMIGFAVDYLYALNPRTFGGISSIVQRVLDLRHVLLVALWVEVIRQRTQLHYVPITLAFAIVPRLGGYFSDFKTPLILMLLVLGSTWRPWERSWWPRSLWALVKGSPVLAALIVLLLVWQGGLKKETRAAYDSGYLGNSPAERIGFFVDNLRQDLPLLFEDPQPFVETLVERLSYVTFFSLVLDHVPEREPHAEGELLKMAVLNAFVPRVLFPEKPELPSDSYYTRRFAGAAVEEGMTSVSIGYMAEFYADWGLLGMYVSILLYGGWIGGMLAVVWRLVPIAALRSGTIGVVALAVMDFEHQFIKGFAALNTNVVVMLAALFLLRPVLMRLVIVRAAPPRGQVPVPNTGAPAA